MLFSRTKGASKISWNNPTESSWKGVSESTILIGTSRKTTFMTETTILIKTEIRPKRKISTKKTTDTSNKTKIICPSKVILLITKTIEITTINKIKDQISKISFNKITTKIIILLPTKIMLNSINPKKEGIKLMTETVLITIVGK